MKRIIFLISLLGSVSVGSVSAFAETSYITDNLKITLRSGESTTHKVIRMLPSGTSVKVLNRNGQTNYTKVRLSDGTTGYVLSRMLLTERPARQRLAEAEKQLVVLRQEPGKLSSQLASLQEAHSALQQEFTEIKEENGRLQQDLTRLSKVAQDPLRIARERDDAVSRSQKLFDEVGLLQLKNQRMTDKTEQNWFLIGAGVIIAGIILGLLLPHMRVKKSRSEWGDF